jgi:uncharacterized OB-fold protein
MADSQDFGISYAHPGLYEVLGSVIKSIEGLGDVSQMKPVMKGMICGSCQRTSVPVQAYGCEGCGEVGEGLELKDLEPVGELLSYALVNKHSAKSIAAPFTMAEIRLKEGPVIRVTLEKDSYDSLKVGTSMEGVFVKHEVEADKDCQDKITQLELRFRPGSKTDA